MSQVFRLKRFKASKNTCVQLQRELIAKYEVVLLCLNCALMNSPRPNLNFANVRVAVEPLPVADLLK